MFNNIFTLLLESPDFYQMYILFRFPFLIQEKYIFTDPAANRAPSLIRHHYPKIWHIAILTRKKITGTTEVSFQLLCMHKEKLNYCSVILIGQQKKLCVILPRDTDLLVLALFGVQHWASPRADKLTFNFEQCHDEAFPQKGSLTKSCFLFSAVWSHYS